MQKRENDKFKSEKMANPKVGKLQMKSEQMANEDEMMRGHLLHCPGQHPREQGHNVIQIEPNQCFTTKFHWKSIRIQNWEESRSEIRLREAGAGSHIQGEMGPICKAINLIESASKLFLPAGRKGEREDEITNLSKLDSRYIS